MTHRYPDFYKEFVCIANRCPDSCCKDWDVVVDSESEAFYNTVKGKLGEKLRAVTVTDEDGDRIFTLQNERCPFWNCDELCDIYIELGEEHLCRTCKSFPRITADYTAFAEHHLSLACPEAARLILSADNTYAEFDKIPDPLICEDYGAELMARLIDLRRVSADIFRDRSRPFSDRIEAAMMLNVFSADDAEALEPSVSARRIFDFFETLDFMSEENKRVLLCGRKAFGKRPIPLELDLYFERLALYLLYRYFLNAIDSGDTLDCILRIACAYIIIGSALAADLTLDPIVLMQKYSKEIEHSYENNEELEFAFAENPYFSAHSLIQIIKVN